MTMCSIAAAATIMLLGSPGADPGGGPEGAAMVVLLDRTLHARPVTLTGLDDRSVTYTDASGLVRTEPLGEYVAVVAEPPPAEGATPAGAVVELTDGQVIVGSLRPGGDEETVRWSHALLGELTIPLERVRRIRLGEPARPAGGEATTEDLVVLANGDVLGGFVGSIGERLVLEVGGQERELALELVAEVRLANPAEPLSGMVLWLSDGSTVAAAAVRTTRLGELEVRPAVHGDPGAGTEPGGAGWSAPFAPSEVLAASLDAARLVPLAGVEVAEQRPLGGRRWTEPVRAVGEGRALLGAADLLAPGPMAVEWVLPAGAERLATEAELPPEMWTWGDCEVVFAAVGPESAAARELVRVRLNRDRPRAPINVALAGAGRLRMTLEAGAYGPVQDRVLLRRPLVLLGESEPGS